jgi:hypothetical protein
MDLTQFKNIFGKPNEGPHRYRFCGFAIVDVLATIVFAYYLSKYLNKDFKLVLLLFFIFGEFLHYIFGVQTAFIKLFYHYGVVSDDTDLSEPPFGTDVTV